MSVDCYLKEIEEYVNRYNDNNSYLRNSLLITCSCTGNLKYVKYLVENNYCTNETNIFGFTAILYAARYGHLNVVHYLISRCTYNAISTTKINMLLLACLNGHYKIVKYLLVNKYQDINYNRGGYLDGTALTCAIKGEHFKVAKYLLKNGIYITPSNIYTLAHNENQHCIIKYINKMIYARIKILQKNN